jgi:hypothetical protein
MHRTKHPRIGDYVLLSKYSDRSPHDPWQVGFVSRIEKINGEMRYCVVEGSQYDFPCCWRITQREGKLICDAVHPRAADKPRKRKVKR